MQRSPLPSRSLAIALLAALILAVAPAPGADAQMLGFGTPPAEESILGDALPAKEVLTDPEKDTEFMGNTGVPVEAVGESDYEATADIVSFTVTENQQYLLFGLKHRAYPETPATASDAVIFQGLQCSIEFRINGDQTRHYEAELYSENWLDGAHYASWARLYEYEQEPGDPDDFDRGDAEYLFAVNVAYDHFEILLPKEMVTANGDGRALRIGDELTDVYIDCFRSLTIAVGYYDEAGGDMQPSVPYRLSAATRSNELEIGFPEGEDGETKALTVGPEGASKLNVVIKNLRERKLLVNVTASIADRAGNPLPGWKVQAAPTFELRANNSLPASVIVTPPANAQHRDGGFLTVRAIPLGFDDHVQVTRWVSVVVSPGPDQNVLHFHDTPWQSWSCGFICGSLFNGIPITHGSDHFVMNTLPVDERLGEEDTDNQGIAMFSSDATYVYLDAPLGHSIRFAPDGLLELTVSLRTDVEREIELQGHVWAGDEIAAVFDASVTVGTTFGTHTLTFPPQPELETVPAGELLGIQVRVNEESLGFTGSTWVDSVDWRPSESSLTLPLMSVPQKVVNITDGRALPTLALSNETDAEEYLNPGDTQAFDLMLVNEGLEKDVVGLKAEVPAGWSVALHPGDQFSLEPGAAAPLCVSITAPEDALDNEQVTVNLTAWSRSDPDVRTTTQLTLIVVNDIKVDEGTCVEEEYVRPFTERERSTPGFGLPAMIGALALLGVALRRRL